MEIQIYTCTRNKIVKYVEMYNAVRIGIRLDFVNINL